MLTQPDKKIGRGQKLATTFNSSAQEVEILQPDNLNDQTFKENLLAKKLIPCCSRLRKNNPRLDA